MSCFHTGWLEYMYACTKSSRQLLVSKLLQRTTDSNSPNPKGLVSCKGKHPHPCVTYLDEVTHPMVQEGVQPRKLMHAAGVALAQHG